MRIKPRYVFCGIATILFLQLFFQAAEAGLPRIYLNRPVGTNLASFEYRFTTGNAGLDDSLPIRNLELDTNIYVAQYIRSFGVAGNNGMVSILLPYADISGTATNPAGEPLAGERSGLGDPTLIVGMSFMGAPALKVTEFRSYKQSTIFAGSVSITPPIGECDKTRVINPGSNRWAVKPELVLSRAIKKWILEFYANAQFFSDNDEISAGSKLKQDPLYNLEAHISYTFNPRLWASIDAVYTYGGEAFVDNISRNNKQDNSDGGATLNFQLGKQSAMRFTYNTKIVVKPGVPDIDLYSVAYIYRW